MKATLCLDQLSILLLILIAIIVELSNGLVHKIPTQLRRLSPEMAKKHLLQKYSKNPQVLDFLTRNEKRQLALASTDGSKINGTIPFSVADNWVALTVANISVGTPPQWFNVELDWYYDTFSEVIDSNATNWAHMVKNGLHLFNSSLSSTYSQVPGGYNDVVTYGKGHRGKDVVNANGQDYQLIFGILDSVFYYTVETLKIDGILGISPGEPTWIYSSLSNFTSTAKQLADQLDSPIITVWSESSREGDGVGQVTLGALDSDHCESNWIFMPKALSNTYYSGYTVHLATMEATWTNGTQESFKANVDLAVVPHQHGIVVPPEWLPLFKNISNAVYSNDYKVWVVDCDTTKSGNVTYHIGGHGLGQNSKTYNLTITGADYTSYYEHYDICYLDVTKSYSNAMPLVLGHNFARDHCLAYNIKDNKIGIADSKTQNTRFLDYD